MKPHQALIVTFYAFKGGTGRTLALANVARLLSEELGYRVGLMDLDIDSPGLVHEALCKELEPGSPDRTLQETIDNRLGFLELFINRQKGAAINEDAIDDYVCALPGIGSGNLILMPTARGSVSKSPEFIDTVDQFTRSFANSRVTSQSATDSTWEIAEAFIDRFQLDFLFIDGRTGAGPFSPVYTYSIPHLLVLFFGLNDQNVTGSLSMLNKRLETDEDSTPVPVFLVASPVPTVGPAALERRLSFVSEELKNRKKGVGRSLYSLPAQVEHFLYYSDAASFGEAYFPGQYPHSLLAQAYRKLASDIERLVITRPEDLRYRDARIALSSDCLPACQIRIALENVHVGLLRQEARAGSDAAELFVFEDYGAEDPVAPWMRLLAGEEGAETDLPDVLMVPHSRLKELSALEQGRLFYELPLDDDEAETFLNYDTLDGYYKNWRKRCVIDGRVLALPFSINATMLCADLVPLSRHCNIFWSERGQDLTGTTFVPGSWQALIELLESVRRAGEEAASVFSMVKDGPGLYYEWLNFVSSLGGYDLILSDGHVDRVGLERDETVRATERFVNLARLSGGSATMDEQIKRFAHGDCSLYMGWTDSFRFERQDGDTGPLRDVSPTSIDGDGGQPGNRAIRLARGPRDMRQQRTCLVEGWVMTFPRRAGHEAIPSETLAFARWLLEPERQRKLLRQGFPAPSSWAVDREREALQIERQRVSDVDPSDTSAMARMRAEASFDVFLTTIYDAIWGGRWTASPRSRIDVIIVGMLQRLIDDPDLDAHAELRSVQERVLAEQGLAD